MQKGRIVFWSSNFFVGSVTHFAPMRSVMAEKLISVQAIFPWTLLHADHSQSSRPCMKRPLSIDHFVFFVQCHFHRAASAQLTTSSRCHTAGFASYQLRRTLLAHPSGSTNQSCIRQSQMPCPAYHIIRGLKSLKCVCNFTC